MIARPFRSTLPALFAALFLTTVCIAPAQNPAQNPASPTTQDAPGAAPQRPPRPIPTPVNLQVLPKDTSGEQVVQIMRHFTGDLGVGCGYCHAKNAETGRTDFASDANPMKNNARIMMRLTNTINATYLTQLMLPDTVEPATCGTCHRGAAKPPVFIPPPRERGPRSAMPPAPTGSAPAPN